MAATISARSQHPQAAPGAPAPAATSASTPIATPSPATVAIFLGTWNGEAFLAEQLESIAAQTHTAWRLYASDDGSTDRTLGILKDFAARFESGKVQVRRGPHQGFAINFLSLACDPEIDADYFAFCDQDDVWHPGRLEASLRWLQTRDARVPLLYCGRTRYVDGAGAPLGLSPLFRQPPAFRNALVQSLAGGNTMTFNRATRALLMRAGPLPVVSHDWWIYQVVSACDGEIHYDDRPFVDYRQHGANVIGSNAGLAARVWRAKEMMKGRFKRWNDLNERALGQVAPLMTPDNRLAFERFRLARRASLIGRIAGLLRSGVYRQTRLGTLGLWFGAVTRRI